MRYREGIFVEYCILKYFFFFLLENYIYLNLFLDIDSEILFSSPFFLEIIFIWYSVCICN